MVLHGRELTQEALTLLHCCISSLQLQVTVQINNIPVESSGIRCHNVCLFRNSTPPHPLLPPSPRFSFFFFHLTFNPFQVSFSVYFRIFARGSDGIRAASKTSESTESGPFRPELLLISGGTMEPQSHGRYSRNCCWHSAGDLAE